MCSYVVSFVFLSQGGVVRTPSASIWMVSSVPPASVASTASTGCASSPVAITAFGSFFWVLGRSLNAVGTARDGAPPLLSTPPAVLRTSTESVQPLPSGPSSGLFALYERVTFTGMPYPPSNVRSVPVAVKFPDIRLTPL